ncbi:MAG: hypothetical protein ACI8PT_004711 [Gammaproteobacteria bacterium]|jgi:hypothetical protein
MLINDVVTLHVLPVGVYAFVYWAHLRDLFGLGGAKRSRADGLNGNVAYAVGLPHWPPSSRGGPSCLGWLQAVRGCGFAGPT